MVNQYLNKYHLELNAVGEGSFYKYNLDIEELQKYIDGYHYADDILINGKTIKGFLVESITIMESEKGANSNMRCDSFKSHMIINKLSKFL